MSRLAYESQCDRARELADLVRQRDAAYTDLLKSYAELATRTEQPTRETKQEGLTLREMGIDTNTSITPTAEPDPIAQIIREQSEMDGRENHALAQHLRTYARKLKRDGLSPDAIAGKLVAWQTSETVGAE